MATFFGEQFIEEGIRQPHRQMHITTPRFRAVKCRLNRVFYSVWIELVNRHITIDIVASLSARGAGGAVCFASGFSEASGLKGNLTLDLSPGFGYTGIIVAMLALLNPLAVVVAALFVAGIFVGADSMSRAADVPTYLADIMLATALLLMVVAIMLTRFRVVRD